MSKLSWNSLFLNGSIVSVSTSLWRARVKITAADLGIENTEEVKSALSLGCHRLAPSSAFDGIMRPAREAKEAVDYYSVNFGLITGARFVPEKNLAKLVDTLKQKQEEFKAAKSAFMLDFEKTRDEMLPVIEAALLRAARTPDAAAEAFRRIQAEYPTADEVRKCFGLDFSVYALSSPKSQAVADAAAQESEGVKSILGDMVKQLRDDLTERLTSMRSIVQKGGKLQQRTVDGALEMVDRVESLNILGDIELKDQCRALRSIFTSLDPKNPGTGLVDSLDRVQKNLESSVQEAIAQAEAQLTGVGRRKLEIEDEPATTASEPEAPDMVAVGTSEVPMEF